MGVVAGAALSREPRTKDAVADAASRALRAAGLPRASFCVCFTTSAHLEEPELARSLRAATGASSLLGCSGAGVFATEGVVAVGPGLAVLVVEGMVATVAAARDLLQNPIAAFDAVGPALVPAEGGAALVLVDPSGGFEARMVSGLDSTGVPVVGGGASGHAAVGVLAGDELVPGGVAVARFSGVRATAGVASSARPIGRPHRITGANRNQVLTLDGRPALEVLRDALSEAGIEPARAGTFLFAGLAADPAGERLDREHRLVRPIVGADPHRGAFTVGERVREGQLFTFCLREAVGARDELREMIAAQELARGGEKPVFGIYLDCVGRGGSLYGETGFDLGQILRRFPGLPLVGLSSSFELGPLAGRTRLHLQSGALLLCG